MARQSKRLASNTPGDFYVDASCIDCETCRWVAPASFSGLGEASRVHRQPSGADETLRAEMAVLACPVGAIGTVEIHNLSAARDSFPDPIEGEVHHCGYHSGASYGAASYFIRREGGNILVDSPRFTGALVARLEAMGGVAMMVLSHEDDIADHARYAAHFGCTRIMHRGDIGADTADVERPIEGVAPVALADDLAILPLPGHSAGSIGLLYRDRFLFTGDHCSWDPEARRIHASRSFSRDWEDQTRSMARLLDHRFEWLLPGHGYRVHLPEPEMKREIAAAVERMRAGS